MRALALAAAGFLVATTVSGAQDVFTGDGSSQVLWRQVFASPQEDWINDVISLPDGSVLAVGFLGRDDAAQRPSDWRALAARLGADGQVLARHEYGAGGGIDAFWAVQPSGERFGFGGFTTRIGGGGIDAWIAVTELDGTIVRENGYGGRGYDRATDIATAADGGFVLVGQTDSFGAGERDVWLVKTDATGIEQWRKTYGGAGLDRGFYIERTGDDGFVIAGVTGRDGDVDVLALKVDRDGRELWRRVVGAPGGNDINHGLALHADGRILLTGYTQSWGARVHDMLAITLAPDGEVLRHEVFGGADDDRVMMARIDAAGRGWLTGYTKSAGAGGWDLFVARVDPSGVFEPFLATFGGPADDHGAAILPLADGTLVVAGYAQLGSSGQDAFVMRIAAPRWTKRRDSSMQRRQIVPR
jgi:hypothetical protein